MSAAEVKLHNAPNSPSTREGLEDAYQLYRLELRRFFELNSRSPHAAEDLIQAMYLCIRNSRPASDVRDPKRYLFRVAWNLLHTENRRLLAEQARATSCEFDEFDSYADRSNSLWVEDDATHALQAAELDRLLAELPRVCRVAVLRQYRDNKSYKEIAVELGVSVHAVKKYIVRSLNHFRMCLNALERGENTSADQGRKRP